MIINLCDLGRCCKEFRVEHGYYQTDVAFDTGYSVENISSFEHGRNDNARILLWYFIHGMKWEQLLERGVMYDKEI